MIDGDTIRLELGMRYSGAAGKALDQSHYLSVSKEVWEEHKNSVLKENVPLVFVERFYPHLGVWYPSALES